MNNLRRACGFAHFAMSCIREMGRGSRSAGAGATSLGAFLDFLTDVGTCGVWANEKGNKSAKGILGNKSVHPNQLLAGYKHYLTTHGAL